jgi:hypothetical protein
MSAADQDRYHAALHAVQSGVAAEHSHGSRDGTPKQLRVGVNSALVNDAALASLLIGKGVITLDEYEAAIADEMEVEQRRYEERLSVAMGKPVTLR